MIGLISFFDRSMASIGITLDPKAPDRCRSRGLYSILQRLQACHSLKSERPATVKSLQVSTWPDLTVFGHLESIRLLLVEG